ncbi:MAG: VWA domain-containing protein [Gammaproteobacteria bacterium]|nr:VWA domain-containing protein [Gammaproteobacteria bacterium]
MLIDVSGSMKKNDPHNLRIPALRLLTQLLPKAGNKTGVWTFAEKVNMLIPWKPVDKAWQEKADTAAGQIHSRGLFTNIPAAIETASFAWEQPDLQTKRSIILLTDGMLDIAKEPEKNAAARRKLLDEALPRLKATGARIHTIALSREADAEVLSKLSGATDGWFQSVDDAEALQRAFLKIFEQAANRDSLPLNDNRFKVDAQIEEFTLLVFRKPGSAAAQLISPSGKSHDVEHLAEGMRWHRDASYDLITVEKPEQGEWVLKAAVDPDNRVLVVSKLGLRTPEIPNNLLAGESILYAASLTEDGELIKRQDFLDLVGFSLQEERAGFREDHPLKDDGQGADSVRGDGRYTVEIPAGEEELTINLDLRVKSPTFERRRQHGIHVYGAPYDYVIRLAKEGEHQHSLELSPKAAVIDLESLQLQAQVTGPDGATQAMPFAPGEGSKLLLSLPVVESGGEYSVVIHAEGRTATGRAFKIDNAPIRIATEPLAGHAPVAQEEHKDPHAKADEHEPKEEAHEPEETEGHTNWALWIGIGLGLNVVLVVAGILLARLLKKRRLAAVAELAGELGD